MNSATKKCLLQESVCFRKGELLSTIFKRLKPYGVATQPYTATDTDFKAKLKNFTCEWLARPGIATSELVEETTSTNWKRIKEDLTPVTQQPFFNEFQKDIEVTFDSFISSFIHVGASMFSLGIHLQAAKSIGNNLQYVAEQAFDGNNLAAFKEIGSLQSYAEAAVKDLMEKQTAKWNKGTATKKLQDIISARKRRATTTEEYEPCTSKTRIA
ncbi:uncharacterized protein LOC144745710 [Ciona intestinalis]